MNKIFGIQAIAALVLTSAQARTITIQIPDDIFDSCTKYVGYSTDYSIYYGEITGKDSYGTKRVYYMADRPATYKPNLEHDTNQAMDLISKEILRKGICPSFN